MWFAAGKESPQECGDGSLRGCARYEEQLLLAAGNPDTDAAPVWARDHTKRLTGETLTGETLDAQTGTSYH